MGKITTIALASAALIAGWQPAMAQTNWNFANAYAATEFQSQGYDMFAKKVSEGTNGAVNITLHHGGSLFPNPEILQATRDGLVEVGTQLMTNLGRENALWDLDGLPFFVSSYDEAKKLWALSRPRMEELLGQTGLKLLFAAPWPTQGFFSKKEIKAVADFKGLKMRAYNPSTTRMAELLGATPLTVQMTETPQAFATGLIDSINTSPTSGVVYTMWDYAPYYLKTDAWIPKQMVFVRKDKFDELSPENQKVVLDASAEAEAWLWDKSESLVAEAEKTFVDKGMTVTRPDEAFAGELKGIGNTMVQEWMANADDQAKAVVSEMQK
ncbi:MAG: TRAP transporter substrate-binding protein [Mesorhizobium sp.]